MRGKHIRYPYLKNVGDPLKELLFELFPIKVVVLLVLMELLQKCIRFHDLKLN